MGGRRSRFAAVSTSAAVLLVLSPWLAPETALASILSVQPTNVATTAGQKVGFTVSVDGTQLNSGDNYQIQMSMGNTANGGVQVTDLPWYAPTFGGTPMAPGQTVTSVVYSVYGGNLGGTTDYPVTLTPIDIGNYQANFQLYDQTTGTTVDQAVYVPVGVTPSSTAQPMGGPFSLNVGSQGNYNLNFQKALTTDPVTYHVQLVHADGTPLAGQDVSSFQYSIYPNASTTPPTYQSVNIGAGVTDITDSNHPTMFDNENLGLQATINTTGDYILAVSVVDTQTNTVLYTAQQQISVGTPNVTFEVDDASGSPVSSSSNPFMVYVQQRGGQSSFGVPVDPTKPTIYLPAGQTYDVTGIWDNGYIPLSQPASFTVDPTTGAKVKVTEPNTGTLQGTVTSDGKTPVTNATIMLYPVTAEGTPDESAQPVSVSSDSTGNINASVPVGNYIATVLWTSGQSPIGINQSVTITKGTNTVNFQEQPLYIDQPSTTAVGRDDWHQVDLGPTLQQSLPGKNVYFTLSVTNGSTPVTSGADIQTFVNGQPPLEFALDSNGNATAGKDKPIAGSDLISNPAGGTTASAPGGVSLATNFSNPGVYTLTYAIVDAATGQAIATTTKNIDVKAPNVEGQIVAPDGQTPVAYENVVLTSTTGQVQYLFANADGKFVGYLPAGTYQVTQLQKWSPSTNSQQTVDVTTQNVTFTVTANETTAQTPTVQDTSINVVGTAYLDSGKTTPLANGYVVLQQEGTTSPQPIGVPTDAQGHFALTLPTGTFDLLQESNMNTYLQLQGKSFTVGSGLTNVTVAPNAPTFKFPVKDALGQTVNSGYIGVLPAAAAASSQPDYSQAVWFPIQSDGTVSGYLTDGNYVAFALSLSNNGYPLSVPFTISGGQPTQAVTIEPPQASMHGTVVDANSNPVAYAGIMVMPTGSTDPSQQVWLSTDGNGNFTDLGWSNTGKYQSVLTVGTAYTIVGVYSQTGYTSLNQSMSALKAGDTWSVKLPGADLKGSVSVDGNTVQSGWIGFAPSGSTNPGEHAIWTSITNGTFQASLPAGSYTVFGVGNDATQQFYNESTRSQQPISITDPSTLLQLSTLNFNNNFMGVLKSNGASLGWAGIELSPVDPASSQFDWSNVQYVSTDANGNFDSYLTPGTWYVIGVGTSSGFTQLDLPENVGSSATQGFTIDVTPNVSGTVTGLPSVQQAWVIIENTTTRQSYSAQINLTSGAYQLNLPADTYQVMGVSTQASNGGNWIDLSSANNTFTVAGSTTVQKNVSLPSLTSGTVSGPSGVVFSYIELQSKTDSTKWTSVPVNSDGTYTTSLLDSDWTVMGLQTKDAYYSATGTLSAGITAGSIQ